MEPALMLDAVQRFVFWGAALALWGTPFFIALHRQHHQRWAILVLDLFVGWTGVGWIAALVWSCSAVKRPVLPLWDEEARVR